MSTAARPPTANHDASSDSDTNRTDQDDYISASGLSLSTRHGPVFSGLSFSFPKGSLAVIEGRSGTGRSTLLLAIGGRMRGLTGSLTVAGLNGLTSAKEIRKTSSIARISGLVDLEGQLSVKDSIIERALIDAVEPRRSEAVFGHAETILQRTFGRDLLVDDLSALDQTLLAVALASLRPAHILILDDADRNLDITDQRELMAALLRITETGVTIVTSTIEIEAVPASAVTLSLSDRP